MSNRIDIGDYLLGELSGADSDEAERLMREDPSFRAQVEHLRPAVSRLESLPAEAWQQLEPPPLVLGDPPRIEPGGDTAPSRKERAGWWPQSLTLRPLTAALASLALLAVGLGAGLLLEGSSDRPEGPEQTLALEPVPPLGDGASGSAELIGADGGEAVIDVSGVGANAPGEFYELWLLNSADDLVSLGSFKVDDSGGAKITVPLPVDPAKFEFVDLSIEREDGDASHSGRSVLRGPT
ncbi:MAG: anti-sigma factor [Solirubrobacterales bacterium]